MFRSVRARLMFTTALLVIGVVIAVVVADVRRTRRLIVASKEAEAKAYASALAAMSLVDLIEHNWGNVHYSLRQAMNQDEDMVFAILSDATVQNRMVAAQPAELDGSYVPDLVRKQVTDAALAPYEEMRAEQTVLVRDVLFGAKNSAPSLRAREGERIVEVDRALFNYAGERIGTLRIGISLRAVDRATREAIASAALSGGVALAIAMLLTYFLASRLTRPLEALSARMRGVGKGEIEGDAKVTGNDEIADLGRAFNSMLTGLRQKKMLEKYVPKGARDDIDKRSSGSVALGGERVRRVIMFSDLRGFTSMSERLAPDAVVRLLNTYLEGMTKVILEHGGDINEYIGDAILAVFSEPKDAVAAAVAMQRALAEIRKTTDDEDMKTLRMGIGLHVGECVLGNIGTLERVKFGVVGDTVNLAARIQDRSRDGKHTCILVSDALRSETERAGFGYELVGDLAMKGKAEPVRVFEVVA